MTHTILLVGFKSSGKSSLGKELAHLLNLPFIDTDTVIETRYAATQGQKLPCREIYSRLGPDALRTLETEALLQATATGDCVIATGGGVVLRQENRDILRHAGTIVFLDTPLPVLEKRLEAHRASPLFKQKTISQLHGERYHLYCAIAALHIIPEANELPEETARRVQRQLKEKTHG